jgi:addiction module HigA family antidote
MAPRKLTPIHPGEILLEEFITPLGVSQSQVARSIGVPPRRVNEIVLGKRAITADTALRLARCFGTSPQFWTNLQAQYDLATEQDRLGNRLDREVRAIAAS